MAARKTVEPEYIEDEIEELEEPVIQVSPITTVVVKDAKKDDEPKVTVFLPELEDSGSAGLVIDQYEHVTLANEDKEEVFYIHRGEHVEVPIRVFVALKEKYPNL